MAYKVELTVEQEDAIRSQLRDQHLEVLATRLERIESALDRIGDGVDNLEGSLGRLQEAINNVSEVMLRAAPQ